MPAFLCAPGLDLDGLLALCVLEQAQSGTDDFTGVVVAAAAIDATPAPPRPARSDDRLAAKRAHPHDLAPSPRTALPVGATQEGRRFDCGGIAIFTIGRGWVQIAFVVVLGHAKRAANNFYWPGT